MLFSVYVDVLKAAMGYVMPAVGARSNVPIFGTVRISADAGANKVTLAATDLSIATRVVIPAKVEEGGQIAIPADLFQQWIKALDNGAVLDVSTDDSAVVAKMEVDGNRLSLKGLPADDFPDVDWGMPESTHVAVPARDVYNSLRFANHAAAKDESRPILGAICYDANAVASAATDGFRLSVDKAVKKGNDPVALIPAAGVKSLGFLNTDGECTASTSLSEDGIVLAIMFSLPDAPFAKDAEISTRIQCVQGRYPNYRGIIRPWDGKFMVNREDMISALRVAKIFSDRVNLDLPLLDDGSTSVMAVSGDNPEEGDAATAVPVSGCEFPIGDEESFSVAFDVKFLIEAFTSFNAVDLWVYTSGFSGNRPIIITNVEMFGGNVDADKIELVMPMQMKERT